MKLKNEKWKTFKIRFVFNSKNELCFRYTDFTHRKTNLSISFQFLWNYKLNLNFDFCFKRIFNLKFQFGFSNFYFRLVKKIESFYVSSETRDFSLTLKGSNIFLELNLIQSLCMVTQVKMHSGVNFYHQKLEKKKEML